MEVKVAVISNCSFRRPPTGGIRGRTAVVRRDGQSPADRARALVDRTRPLADRARPLADWARPLADCARSAKSLLRPALNLLAGVLVMVALSGGAVASDQSLKVFDVRLGVHPDKTRVVLDVDSPAEITAFRLINPNRIVMTLPEVDWQVPFASGERRLGAVSSVHYGSIIGGEGRLTLELGYPVEIAQTLSLNSKDGQGHRIVIDLKRTSAKTFVAQARQDRGQSLFAAADLKTIVQPLPKPAAGPAAAGDGADSLVTAGLKPALTLADEADQAADLRAEKFVIVIDPGHGGRDPGALSESGVEEAAVVLAMAKQLKQDLDKSGRYLAVLTRTDDTSLKLRERIEFARKQDADLFISIHADSLDNAPNVRGASVYTLDEDASDKEAAALAKKENRADIILGVDLSTHSRTVNDILIKLAMRESKNASVRFSQLLMPQIGRVTPLMRTNLRSAGFAVLKAPDVPSVLLELGYLSNASDEENLQSQTWRKNVSKSITRAIDLFFGYEVADLNG